MSAFFVAEVGAFCAAARRRQLRGPAACARRAAEILRLLVANGRHPDPCSLIADVRKQIGALATPDSIRFAAAVPKTRSGKIMRRLLRDIAAGKESAGDTTTLEDYAVLAKLRETEE